jgi:hypothetical protein
MDPIARLKEQLSRHPEVRFAASATSIDIQAPPEGFAVGLRVAPTGFTVNYDRARAATVLAPAARGLSAES